MQEQATVATASAEVAAMQPGWALAAALLGGTDAMRAAANAYLPQWPKESDASYQARLNVSVLFPAYKRTVQTLTGKPFSKPVKLNEDIPAEVLPWLDDVDLEGRVLHSFIADMLESALGMGICGILVDYPTVGKGVQTVAQERALGARPYFVHIKPQQILGWRARRANGKWVIEQLRIMECVAEPDGEFGVASVEQVRVLTPGAWAVYRMAKTDKGEQWVAHDEGVTSLNVVPFVPVYGRRTGFMLAEPPLIDVAHLNVAHWQSASDQQALLHTARVPILAAFNVQDYMSADGSPRPWELTIGAGAAVRLNGDGADLRYIEHTGAAIGAGVTDLKDLEERMRQAGAQLLVIDKKLTATQVHIEDSVGMSALQRIVLDLEDSIAQALGFMAQWAGLGQAGGTIEIYKDFVADTLQDSSAALLLQANQAGKISDETLHSELQRRGLLSDQLEWTEEKDRLDMQGPAMGLAAPVELPAAEPAIHAPVANPSQAVEPVEPIEQPLDLAPVISAIQALAQALKEKPEAMDMAPLLAALAQQPTINVTAPPADMTGIAAAISAMQPAQVNVTTPAVTVAPSDVTVNMPEQPAAQVSVAAPVINVTPPAVTVNVDKTGGKVTFTEDAQGRITGAALE